MNKTQLTHELERQLWKYTKKRGTFGCFEVTIGWRGKERVDYLTYDTKGTCELPPLIEVDGFLVNIPNGTSLPRL